MSGKIALQDIVNAIADRYDLTVGELRGPSKLLHILRPRQIAMYLAREMTGLSVTKIGAYFYRDHTTVTFSKRRIEALMVEFPEVAAAVAECRALVIPRHKENIRAMAAQPLMKKGKDG